MKATKPRPAAAKKRPKPTTRDAPKPRSGASKPLPLAADPPKPLEEPQSKPAQTDRDKGQAHRELMARRSREMSASVSDIGELPPVVDPARKESCRLDLHKFLVTYFPSTTGLSPFSEDHCRVIARLQSCILHGGRFVNAVYRGFAKTTIGENAAIWATIYGHRKLVPIIAAASTEAEASLDSIKFELSENDLLYEDFPEVIHAIRALEGRPQRRLSQSYKGQLTYIEWNSERIIYPKLPGSVASSATICTRGMTSGIRGLKQKLADGTQQRPDMVIGDDIQTDETASTANSVEKTLGTLRKAVAKLGGHRKRLAIVINATVIQPDDAIDRLLKDPAWQGERIPMVRQWPKSHESFWLTEYADARRNYDKDSVNDQARAHAVATDLYRRRRAEADDGAVVSWANCFDPETELSAIQHAYNMLIDDGEEAFASECQNQPIQKLQSETDLATPDKVLKKLSGVPRHIAPLFVSTITVGVDVMESLLYYVVIGWGDDYTGHVIDLGAWPDQKRNYWALVDARPTLAAETKAPDREGRWYQGLQSLTNKVLGQEYVREDGANLRVSRCLIDANDGDATDVIYQFCRQSKFANVVIPYHGRAATVTNDPYRDYRKKQGERAGLSWRIPNTKGSRAVRHVLADPNYWKSFVHARLLVPTGSRGALTLFGDDPAPLRIFADHVNAERTTKATNDATGRQYTLWSPLPSRPDNHFLDATYLAAVAANIEGVNLPEQQSQRTQARKKPRSLAAEQAKAQAKRFG